MSALDVALSCIGKTRTQLPGFQSFATNWCAEFVWYCHWKASYTNYPYGAYPPNVPSQWLARVFWDYGTAYAGGNGNAGDLVIFQTWGYRKDDPAHGAHVGICCGDGTYVSGNLRDASGTAKVMRNSIAGDAAYNRAPGSWSGEWMYIRISGGGPGPGPGPEPPIATQPIEPEYGPGDQIWLTKVAFSCHYVDSTYVNPDTGQHDVYFHPAMKLLINGNVVATSKKGIAWGFNLPGQGEYTDIYWASESPDGIKTNDFQVRLNGDHPDADRFDIIGTDPSTNWTYIEYYLCKPEEYDESLKPDRAVFIGKEKYTSYFDGTKWTTFKKE